MSVLESEFDLNSPEFQTNRENMLSLIGEWKKRLELVKLGGGREAMEKHKARGKLTARERIEGLLDPGTSFLEFSTLAAWDMYEGQARQERVLSLGSGLSPGLSA
jgi:3-methylcrotonyl-CoA carboxylase beta subunit